MYSVVITEKKTGAVVAQVSVSLQGQNYTPSPDQYRARAWRIAIDDKLVAADADRDDYAFELVPVSMHDAFAQR